MTHFLQMKYKALWQSSTDTSHREIIALFKVHCMQRTKEDRQKKQYFLVDILVVTEGPFLWVRVRMGLFEYAKRGQ